MVDSCWFHESVNGGPFIARERLIKSGSVYLCWNSFKSEWFWGPRRLSERLSELKAQELLTSFGGKIVTPRMEDP